MRHHGHTMYRNVTLLLTALLGLASPVLAVDGVIEINQTRALAGGVTASDTEGFPVTIDAPGSYRLTGNLEVAATAVHAVEITADNVTLDLNGFAIVGPGSGSGSGVVGGSPRENITVVNGTVRDMGASGVYLGDRARVERVRTLNNGGTGIYAWNDSTVSGNTAYNNTGDGIYASNGSTVTGNTANSNGDDGIRGGFGITVTGNTVYNNGGDGISTVSGSTVTGNTARNNTGYGLYLLGSYSGYANNVLTGNTLGTVSGGIQMGTNVCGADTTCP